MISRVLVITAWVCCLLVIASYTLFVHDQLISGSKTQQALVSGTSPTAPAPSHHRAGQPRRFIVAAAHDLTSPFSGVISSDDAWVTHSIPAVLSLLVYGGGLGFAARFTKGLS